MKRSTLIFWTLAIGLFTFSRPSVAAEFCISSIDGVQMVADQAGALSLYVYSKELPPPSTYLYYKGTNEVAKVFQAQFLYVKAVGGKACVIYTSNENSYQWVLTSVGVSATGWPWQ